LLEVFLLAGKKMTKTETKRALLAMSAKCSKLMDSYFAGNRHQSLSCMKKLQSIQMDVNKLYDKVK